MSPRQYTASAKHHKHQPRLIPTVRSFSPRLFPVDLPPSVRSFNNPAETAAFLNRFIPPAASDHWPLDASWTGEITFSPPKPAATNNDPADLFHLNICGFARLHTWSWSRFPLQLTTRPGVRLYNAENRILIAYSTGECFYGSYTLTLWKG